MLFIPNEASHKRRTAESCCIGSRCSNNTHSPKRANHACKMAAVVPAMEYQATRRPSLLWWH